MEKVKAVKDDDGHWFLIPNDLAESFYDDFENEAFVDSGEFDDKYRKYMIGNINSVQLYAEI